MSERGPTQPEMRETNIRLNRRVQAAEKALGEWQRFVAVAKEQRTGRSLPAVQAYALIKAGEENAALRARVARLHAVLVNLLVPIEGFWMDEPSRTYLAPEVRRDLEAALMDARAALDAKGTEGENG